MSGSFFNSGRFVSQDFEKKCMENLHLVIVGLLCICGSFLYLWYMIAEPFFAGWSAYIFWPFVFGLFYVAYTILDWSRRSRYSWKGRHVFITGGSEGIGLEVAKILVKQHGVSAISLFSRSREKLEKAKLEIGQTNTAIHLFPGDVSKPEDVTRAMNEAKTKGGPIHVVLAAAGFAISKYFEDLSGEDFQQMIQVNYMGVVHAAQTYLGSATNAKTGSSSRPEQEGLQQDRKFIAVCSIAAAVPFIGYAAYAPSKVAVRAFCDCLRNEFADVPRTDVHICFPPDMDTAGFKKENETKPIECKTAWPEAFNELFQPQDVANDIINNVILGRYHLHSPDIGGNYLVSRAWGHHPRNHLILEMILAPIFVLIHEIMVFMVDRKVVTHDHHLKKEIAACKKR